MPGVEDTTLGCVGDQRPMVAGVEHHEAQLVRVRIWISQGEEHGIATWQDLRQPRLSLVVRGEDRRRFAPAGRDLHERTTRPGEPVDDHVVRSPVGASKTGGQPRQGLG